MATTKEIKRRIKSVKSTKKITKAMELVAASKMKRAVNGALASRTYAVYAKNILDALQGSDLTENGEMHPILRESETNNVLIVLITSNRGLCGGYNAQITKKVIQSIKLHHSQDIETGKPVPALKFIVVGKKGESMLARMGEEVIASFTDVPEIVSLRDVMPIAEMAISEYKEGHIDKILVAYTDFKSALTQEPKIRQLLPLSVEELKKSVASVGPEDTETKGNGQQNTDYVFEPDKTFIMKVMIWKLVQMQMYQMVVESFASEQSARMMAMKNASEAAGEMIDDLTLVFNKARQASITQEISEISGGTAAMS